MTLTAEQAKELTQFPQELRALIESELAAGNSIVEVGHSLPAPPAGAYFKLTIGRPREMFTQISFPILKPGN
jgi:hypothetical protein